MDETVKKAKWAIAGRTPVEKHGSFTNCDGIVQPFRRALKGTDNYEELSLFVELLKKFDIKPVGRTVAEIQKNSELLKQLKLNI